MTNPPLELFLTPLSHFSRKVRIVLEELGVACELTYVPNLLSDDPADFGGNPILRVPVLREGRTRVVESDAIVRYLLETRDPGVDRFGLFGCDPAQRNALAFLSAIMGAEVEILLAGRAGLESGPNSPFFSRYHRVIRESLRWLEREGPGLWPDIELSYLDIALISMWDHLQHGGLGPDDLDLPWIERQVARHDERQSVRATAPDRMQELQWQLYPEQRPEP